MFTLLEELGVTPVSMMDCTVLPKVVGSDSSWQLWQRSRRLDGEWEDESLFCSSGPRLELGGAFGSGWLQTEEEILPWVFADVLQALRL